MVMFHMTRMKQVIRLDVVENLVRGTINQMDNLNAYKLMEGIHKRGDIILFIDEIQWNCHLVLRMIE